MSVHFNPEALRLYAITGDGAALNPAFKRRVREWLQAGVRAIQLRDKALPGEDVERLGRFLRPITAEYGALLIVNDEPRLAVEIGADGCHLGQGDLSIAEARRIMGSDKIIGLSTHTREQVLAADHSGADYIGVGPIFRSSSKDVGREVMGPEFAGWAAEHSALPTVAIGGIGLGNAAQVAAAGCRRIAAIGALNEGARPGEVARALLGILNSADPAKLA